MVWKMGPGVNCASMTPEECAAHLAALPADKKYYFASHIWVGDNLAWHPLGGDDVDLWNHSNDPNISPGSFDGIASKDIQAGEEMFCDYSTFEYPQWLMEIYEEHKVPYDYIGIKKE
jgi:hypothetical protein